MRRACRECQVRSTLTSSTVTAAVQHVHATLPCTFALRAFVDLSLVCVDPGLIRVVSSRSARLLPAADLSPPLLLPLPALRTQSCLALLDRLSIMFAPAELVCAVPIDSLVEAHVSPDFATVVVTRLLSLRLLVVGVRVRVVRSTPMPTSTRSISVSNGVLCDVHSHLVPHLLARALVDGRAVVRVVREVSGCMVTKI